MSSSLCDECGKARTCWPVWRHSRCIRRHASQPCPLGCRQARPPLRVPSARDLRDLGRTCGPATALYVAKNACYIVLQAAATTLPPLAVAAHQPVCARARRKSCPCPDRSLSLISNLTKLPKLMKLLEHCCALSAIL